MLDANRTILTGAKQPDIYGGPSIRATLDIDDDVLALARGRVDREHVSIGSVISQLARTALQRPSVATTTCNGLPELPNAHTTGTVPELVNQMCDEAPWWRICFASTS